MAELRKQYISNTKNKHSILTIVFICIFSCLINKSATQTCSNELHSLIRNSPHQYLKNIILTSPAYGKYDMCKQIWNAQGTCCSQDAIKTAIPQLLDTWTDQSQMFINSMNDLRPFIAKNRYKIITRLISMY
jgi:hypothetical protein